MCPAGIRQAVWHGQGTTAVKHTCASCTRACLLCADSASWNTLVVDEGPGPWAAPGSIRILWSKVAWNRLQHGGHCNIGLSTTSIWCFLGHACLSAGVSRGMPPAAATSACAASPNRECQLRCCLPGEAAAVAGDTARCAACLPACVAAPVRRSNEQGLIVVSPGQRALGWVARGPDAEPPRQGLLLCVP